MEDLFNKALKLIVVFYELGRSYARSLVASSAHFVYADDGDGNITISIEED